MMICDFEESKIPLQEGDFVARLFLLGVVGNVFGIAPDHDEHHGGFIS